MTSERGLPPLPSGASPQDLYQWALTLNEFLLSRFPAEAEVSPRPVLLQHQTGTPLERADTAGVVMYDPTAQRVVVADAADWVPLATDEAIVYATDFDDLVLSGAWQPLVPSSPTVVEPGTYLITIQGLVTGTGGNASYQFRLTVDGVPVQTGTVKSIGNGEVRALSLSFHAVTGGGTVALEATGNNCTVSSSDAVLTRVGAP